MPGHVRAQCAAIVTALMLQFCAAPISHAETRALLVGVSQFKSKLISDLRGPANDLAAMEDLLRAQQASDITVLRDDAVSRTTVETALHALGLRSKPGDWIVFYYSGHGAQAEASVKGTGDGDKDQFLPLAGFDPDEQDPERFIVDKDFYTWIARYIPRTTQVLMIADACHSGTLHRSIDPRAWAFGSRLALSSARGSIQLATRPAPRFPGVLSSGGAMGEPAATREDLPNLVYIGAALDDQLALEAPIPVDGAPVRGVLTYAFEQALTTFGPDGKGLAGDLDQNGTVSVGEIGSYLNSYVRALTGQRQESTAYYVTGKENLGLFERIAPPDPQTDIKPVPAKLALPSVFANDPAMMSRLAGDNPWRVAENMTGADFVWDVGKTSVLRRSGDVVAENIRTIPAIRGVVEKWDAVAGFQKLLSEGTARLVIGPGRNDVRHAPGTKVTLTLQQNQMSDGKPRYATVFNLAADGTVQRIYPVDGDGDGLLAAGQNLPVLETKVVQPYGADHVIALLTPESPDNFRLLLRSIEYQRAAGRLVAPITELLKLSAGKGSLSIAELYSGP